MAKALKVTLLMDQAWLPAHDPQLLADEVEPITERHVAITLRNAGHEVDVLAVDDDIRPMIQSLTDDPPDIVFNLVEQFWNDRRLATNVVAVLEMMGVPFTGSGSTGLMLCQDKGLCKELLSHHRIRVPRFAFVATGRQPRVPRAMRYPLIVKPRYEEGSQGIAKTSVVHSPEELAERLRIIHETWVQGAIVEEYIEGRELYVSVMGNRRLNVFPIRELYFGDSDGPDVPIIATGKVKHDAEYRKRWNIQYRFARLPEELEKRLARVARRAYRALHLRGYGRIDLRVTPEGRVAILEVNANPDIAWGDDFSESAHKAGIDYDALIQRVVNLGLAAGPF